MNNHNKHVPVYTKQQELAIQSEFQRIKGKYYLEHAGSTLYSEKQISDVLSDLTNNLYANPHARSTLSKLTEDSIDQIRFQILEHFKASTSEYSVIFTNGATGALKLISETFNYNGGCLVHLQDNHTSVLGMRSNALSSKVLLHDDAFDLLNKFNSSDKISCNNDKNSLFVYPAQCNFSGTKYPLEWIEKVQGGALNSLCSSKKWYCFVDAAAYVSTNFLDLTSYKPDFICLSFYKIFGYPTGLGALLVKKTSEDVLVKKYYGGGTVYMALSLKNIAVQREAIHERYEDGTLPFLSILSLKHGFETLNRLNLDMETISKHTFSLARYVYNQLLRLHHSNGNPVAILYHDTTFEDRNHQGAIVNFNLLRSNGRYIGYAEVLHIANLFGIQLRTGCFCNPGSCQRHLKLSTDDVIKQFESGHVCGDQNDLINGLPTGSVRVSFGYMSTKEDADELISMIEECFVEKPSVRRIPRYLDDFKKNYYKKFFIRTKSFGDCNAAKRSNTSENGIQPKNLIVDNNSNSIEMVTKDIEGSLDDIFVYPIKSCGAFKVESTWELVDTGLKFDREWMIVNKSGVCLTQKTNSNLCKIKPFININDNMLELSYEGMPKTSVPLTVTNPVDIKVFPCQSKVCGDPIVGWHCGEKVSNWLCKALNEDGLCLLRQSSDTFNTRKKTVNGESVSLSLANQAQFLLVNKSSVKWLSDSLTEEIAMRNLDDLISRFRPNFVVDFGKPFIENDLKELNINDITFKVNGKCTRCQMICIDQNTGEKSVELLRILSREFHGKINFGMYFQQKCCIGNVPIICNKSLVLGKIICDIQKA